MIPERTLQGLKRYVNFHIAPGGFLEAVLENNLVEAMGRADCENREALFEICHYVYNKLPIKCWGNRDKVAAWLGQHNSYQPKEGQSCPARH